MFINYAHRGASEYAPENTFSAFYLGMLQGANGIETDVRRTKDGVLVLFHDDKLDRVTNAKGSFYDYTYKQLCDCLVHNNNDNAVFKTDKIVRLKDFINYFHFASLEFAIELKQQGLEDEVLDLIYSYRMDDKTIITSFDFENLIKVRQLNKSIKIGYLTDKIDDEILYSMKDINANQICPNAKAIDNELVESLKAQGFSVRAWGVSNEELMGKAYKSGVDGMTVNFPDKLQRLIG